MQILLELTQDPDGRLSGSAGLTDPATDATVPFSGTLQLVAVLEDLCRRTAPATPARPDHALPITAKDPS